MKNIILIGMMGCGKTTCGGLLSRRLDRELVDTDALIAAREGRSIPEIFAAQGDTDSVLMLRGKRFLIFGKIFWTRFSVHIPEK